MTSLHTLVVLDHRQRLGHRQRMAAAEVDAYLESLDEPKRSTLQALRKTILGIVPDAKQTIRYGAPAFKLREKSVAGFSAAKDHLTYLPHSGHVLSAAERRLSGYKWSKGALKFPIDEPLPPDLVEELITLRLRETGYTRSGNPIDRGRDASAGIRDSQSA